MLINYKNVDISQQEKKILNGIDFTINKGDFVYLIGKVGAGKSSILKSIYAELPIKKGQAEVLGLNLLKLKSKHISTLRKQLGIIFQDFQLLTDRTVYENLEFVLKATGWKNKNEIKQRINEVLEDVEMTEYAQNFPHELSGGEQQRIAIARAILNNPKIILADEPTGNLDHETGQKILLLLKKICAKGSAVLLTTHNLELLQQFPGIVYRCQDGELSEITELYHQPESFKNNEEINIELQ